MQPPHAVLLNALDFAIIGFYFAVTLLIGWLARRRALNSAQYLNAGRSLPLWIVVLSFVAANCGALEVVGLSAMSAEYGMLAVHFYWIGAIPGMVFLALWMLPVYRASGAASLIEFLRLRYGKGAGIAVAFAQAVMMLLLSGISLYVLARICQTVLGWSFSSGALFCSLVVLVYIGLGGVKATIFNEVLQLGVILCGLVPLLVICLERTHGLVRLLRRLPPQKAHAWLGLSLLSPHAPMDVTGTVLGLGFVLSFSYWCTDFVLMQRALAARTPGAARQVPLWAALGKLLFSVLVVIPGLASMVLLHIAGRRNFDDVLPVMMSRYLRHGLLGLGITALLASLMSALAANISGFSALWTKDLYAVFLRPGLPDRHYIRMGRMAYVAAVAVALLTSSWALHFGNITEYGQFLFSLFNAPLLAIFLLGIFSTRVSGQAALGGFLGGVAVALLHNAAVSMHWVTYGSQMAFNFYNAIASWTAAMLVTWFVTWIVSRRKTPAAAAERADMTWSGISPARKRPDRIAWALAAFVLLLCLLLNLLFR